MDEYDEMQICTICKTEKLCRTDELNDTLFHFCAECDAAAEEEMSSGSDADNDQLTGAECGELAGCGELRYFETLQGVTAILNAAHDEVLRRQAGLRPMSAKTIVKRLMNNSL